MTLPTELQASKSIAQPSGSSKRSLGEAKTPSMMSPVRMATPPPPSERGRLESRHNVDSNTTSSRRLRQGARSSDVARSTPFDADALDHALLREFQRPQRESTPSASPSRKRQRINGDRSVNNSLVTIVMFTPFLLTCFTSFIPTRSGQDLQASFSLLHEDGSPATPSKQKKRTPHGELHFQKSESNVIHSTLEATTNFLQPRKRTAPSQRFFVLSYSRARCLKRHLNCHHQIMHYPMSLKAVHRVAPDPTLLLTTPPPLLYHHHSLPQHPTRIYFRTCHRAIIVRSLAIQPPPKHHRAAMGPTWTQERKYTACLPYAWAVNRCF